MVAGEPSAARASIALRISRNLDAQRAGKRDVYGLIAQEAASRGRGQRCLRCRIFPPLEPGEFEPFVQLQEAIAVLNARVIPCVAPPPVIHVELAFLQGQPGEHFVPVAVARESVGTQASPFFIAQLHAAIVRSTVVRTLMRIKADARSVRVGDWRSCIASTPERARRLGKSAEALLANERAPGAALAPRAEGDRQGGLIAGRADDPTIPCKRSQTSLHKADSMF